LIGGSSCGSICIYSASRNLNPEGQRRGGGKVP
jgi:hypothetical protein